eukprot:354954-Chlamydomonas_euryale.AAC.9
MSAWKENGRASSPALTFRPRGAAASARAAAGPHAAVMAAASMRASAAPMHGSMRSAMAACMAPMHAPVQHASFAASGLGNAAAPGGALTSDSGSGEVADSGDGPSGGADATANSLEPLEGPSRKRRRPKRKRL